MEISAEEEDRQLAADQANIAFVQNALHKSNDLTDKMLTILLSFERRLSSLETTMLPIHAKTQSLTLAQRHIESTMSEIDSVFEHYKISEDSYDSVRQRFNIQTDSYLAWVEKLNESIQFFSANASFKSSEKSMRRLKDLSKRAMQDCSVEFDRILTDNDKIFEPKSKLVPDTIEWIPTPVISRLGKLTECMDSFNDDAYIETLKKHRSEVLKGTLKRVMISAEDALKQQHQENDEKRYVKGSHRFVFYIRLFLKCLESEKQLIHDILSMTNFSPSEIDVIFYAIIDPSVDWFIKRFDEVLKDKYAHKVLVLLDLLDCFQHSLSSFEKVLAKNGTQSSQISRWSNLIELVSTAARKSLFEYRDHIVKDDDTKNMTSDGARHNLTIETMQFAKTLVGFRPSLESALRFGVEELKAHVAPTPLGSALLMIVDALETNLAQKAQTFRQRTLQIIFQLNNSFYILKTFKAPDVDLIRFTGSAFVANSERRLLKLRADYRHESWSEAMQFIDTSDSDELIAKNDRKAIKTKFANFNEAFEVQYNAQRKYAVPDSDLRSQLRSSNVQYLLDAYKQFHDKYLQVDFSTQKGKYMKYSPVVLEGMLNKFFDEFA